VRLLASEPALLEAAVLPALGDYSSSRNESLASLLAIAAQHLLLTEPPQQPEHLPSPSKGAAAAAVGSSTAARAAWEARLVRTVRLALPWTTSFVHSPRSFGQLVVWRLLELFPRVLVALDPTMASLLTFFQVRVRPSPLPHCCPAAASNYDVFVFGMPRGARAQYLRPPLFRLSLPGQLGPGAAAGRSR
jgi:hypothetical protein